MSRSRTPQPRPNRNQQPRPQRSLAHDGREHAQQQAKRSPPAQGVSTADPRAVGKALGQNFLRRERLARQLVAQAAIGPRDLVVEIGPGRGRLTQVLAEYAHQVLAIERDPAMVALLRERLLQRHNAAVVEADILTMPLPATRYRVFANIPFNLTAAIVRRLLEDRHPPHDAWLVMQREAAARYLGRPQMTLVAALWQPWWEISIAHHFERRDFEPRPAVDSVLLHFQRRTQPLVPAERAEWYAQVVTHGFTAWQPTVAAALSALIPADVLHAAARAGLDLQQRPSQTPLATWLALAELDW